MIVLPKSWSHQWQKQDFLKYLFALKGKIYSEQKGRKTLRFTFNDKHYFVKLHQGVGWKEIIKNLLGFRLPVLGAQNEWRAIQQAEKLGIETMRLVGYGKTGWNPARLKSFVITEELADTVSLEDFCRDWPTSPPDSALKHALITKVAKTARMLHEHGMNHRDLYICHFLLNISPIHILPGQKRFDHRIKLYLIDLHRMQIRRCTPERWRVKDIAALYFSSMDIGLTRRDLLRFIRVYQNKPLRASLYENKLFWQRVKKRGIAFYKKLHKKNPALIL